ncbi:hypothetical protein ACQPYK_44745 [Streptosporangium sp. CA-135522]|uniref:hypothetical protein n=1 Tax=Streptosporangium sp. CA-135522 TaxID=3240072 RepID=UPI003D909EA6
MRLKIALIGGVVALALGAGLVGTAMADEPARPAVAKPSAAPAKPAVESDRPSAESDRPSAAPAVTATPRLGRTRPGHTGVRAEPEPAPAVRQPRYTG